MLAGISPNVITPIIVILVIQYCLALFALLRLFRNKPDKLNSLLWNIIIVLLIFVGPKIYLIIERPKKVSLTQKVEPQKEEKKNDYNDYSI